MEKKIRTIARTITFRILATITTMLLVLIFTKNWAIVGSIGILDIISKLALYYIHERVWDNIQWGLDG